MTCRTFTIIRLWLLDSLSIYFRATFSIANRKAPQHGAKIHKYIHDVQFYRFLHTRNSINGEHFYDFNVRISPTFQLHFFSFRRQKANARVKVKWTTFGAAQREVRRNKPLFNFNRLSFVQIYLQFLTKAYWHIAGNEKGRNRNEIYVFVCLNGSKGRKYINYFSSYSICIMFNENLNSSEPFCLISGKVWL